MVDSVHSPLPLSARAEEVETPTKLLKRGDLRGTQFLEGGPFPVGVAVFT